MILFLLFGNIWCRGVVIAVHFQSKFGRKTGKTPHVALMSHPSTTTIYFGTDNFTKTYSTSTGQHVDAQLFNQFTKGLFVSFTFHSLNSWQGDEELRSRASHMQLFWIFMLFQAVNIVKLNFKASLFSPTF